MTTILWDEEKKHKLMKAYNKAAKNNADTFTFEGHLFVTAYAKYLLEYLEYKLE